MLIRLARHAGQSAQQDRHIDAKCAVAAGSLALRTLELECPVGVLIKVVVLEDHDFRFFLSFFDRTACEIRRAVRALQRFKQSSEATQHCFSGTMTVRCSVTTKLLSVV